MHRNSCLTESALAGCALGTRESRHSTAWLLIAALAVVSLLPPLLLRGMSLDGVIYSTVSRNMAVGIGDAWHPIYRTAGHAFHEHPPLAFVIQSALFRLLGDHWWVDRLYSTLTCIPTGLVLVLIWRRLVREAPRLRAFGWLPIALWVLMPAWPWIYRNNLLENTLGIFTALAVYAALRAIQSTRGWTAWTALAALAIVAAVLSKGPVGLFPLATPAMAWLALRPPSAARAALVQGLLVVSVAACLGVLLAAPASRDFLATYFNQQVARSLRGHREPTDSSLGQFQLVWVLFQDLAPSAFMAGLCVFFARRRAPDASDLALRGSALFCLLVGASASIPIMFSPKQTGYYAAPSWPFYMLAVALWSAPAVEHLLNRAKERPSLVRAGRWLRPIAVGTLVLTVALSPLWAGAALRDKQLLADVEQIGRAVGDHATVMIRPDMINDWSLQAYLYRMFYISTEVGSGGANAGFQLEPANVEQNPPAGCTPQAAGLTMYRLYRRSGVAAPEATVTRAR
jgi:4-amino-4-deoxy-L-arabinose transferase-like glycosyltransferase